MLLYFYLNREIDNLNVIIFLSKFSSHFNFYYFYFHIIIIYDISILNL